MLGPHKDYRGNRISPMQFVLMVTLRKGRSHGYQILKDLREHFEGVWEPKTGAIYPALKRLQEHGLLSSKMVDDKELYELSEEGSSWLRETIRDTGGMAPMAMRYMAIILEAYEEEGFPPGVPFSCMENLNKEERLETLRRMQDGIQFNLQRINDLIQYIERDEEWEI